MFLCFFQAEDGIRDYKVTGVQTCALPIYKVGKNTIFVPRLKFAHTPSDHSAHNHRRPIKQRHQRTRNQADALQWLLLDVEAPVHQREEWVKPRSSSNYESRYGWKKCDQNR